MSVFYKVTSVGDLLLPLDVEDASELSSMEQVPAFLLPVIRWPGFTAVEKGAQHASKVNSDLGLHCQPVVVPYVC